MSEYANIIGIVGVILTLVAYYFINIGKWQTSKLSYIMCNLVGSSMLLYSLLFYWNLSSVLIEIAWISISLIGLARYLRMAD